MKESGCGHAFNQFAGQLPGEGRHAFDRNDWTISTPYVDAIGPKLQSPVNGGLSPTADGGVDDRPGSPRR